MRWRLGYTTPGHWTIEGCVTSQFENHLRAICDMPLGSTRALGHTAMINFLGLMPDRERLLAIDGLAYHDYGKTPRPGRKLGHCTILKRLPKERNMALATYIKIDRMGLNCVSFVADHQRLEIAERHVSRTLQIARIAVPLEPGPAIPVFEQAACARQGLHGIDHLVHRRFRRNHR